MVEFFVWFCCAGEEREGGFHTLWNEGVGLDWIGLIYIGLDRRR